MENLDKLSATGLPIFDLNEENLNRSDWAKTSIGTRDSWPTALTCLVNTCVLPMPHCAAIFWGTDLIVIHNLAWEKARGGLDGQATNARNSYSHEALGTLKTVLRGRTVKVAARYFLEDLPDDKSMQLLLSTILDESGTRQGVLAQLLENQNVDHYMPIEGLDDLSRRHQGRRPKDGRNHQSGNHAKTEQADSMQTNMFQRFAELLPNGLAILDKDAEAIFVNDGFFKLTTNKGNNEFRAWPESIHPDDYEDVMSAYRKAFESRTELQIEFRCDVVGPAERLGEQWRLFLLKPLSEEADAGYISAVIDITDIKQAQLTQEKAANEAKERKEQQERFIDMVSHEIRNPLSAVLHLAEEVKEVTKEIAVDHEDIRDQVADILDAADTILLCVSHQNTLVDDILSFSKLDSMMLSLVPRQTRPKWEFSQALRVFHSEFKAKNIDFHYAMDVSFEEQNVDTVVADLNRMKQVLVNLITNAIKFTSRKNGERKIIVSMGASMKRPTSYPPNVIYFSEEKEAFHLDSTMTSEWGAGAAMYLMVAVKDTGIGISKDDQAKLFERFSSKEGEGSTFGFFFKVRRATGNYDDDRPTIPSRSNSECSTSSNRPSENSSKLVRPGYSRANSNLQPIKERNNERPEARTQLSSHGGVDTDDVDPSLKDPPVEERPESHPQSHEDARYQETREATKNLPSQQPHMERKLPDLKRGETSRQEEGAKEISRSQSDQRSEDKYTLLLVEDNLINQKVLRRQLQSRGFEVFTANNGQEAIDAVAERGEANNGPGDRNYFDCILMDQEMPIKDGNTATQEIRVLQDEGKAGYSHILGVSANVREAQTNSMREAGMDDVISKPFKVDDLVRKVRRLVRNNGGSAKHDNRPNGNSAPEKVEKNEEGRTDLHPQDDDEKKDDADPDNERDNKRRGGSRSRANIREGTPQTRSTPEEVQKQQKQRQRQET
ncbi:Two component histidine kinase 1 [Pyrenophora teres f. maculata]|nr:Two component histidine kinase 1 [Pyrenophora teres f. maculata]